MPDMISLKSPDLEKVERRIAELAARRDEFVMRNLRSLGRRVSYIMRQTISENRHTGGLEESITSDVSGLTLTVGPTAKSGGWDRGLILELGTGPHTPPFEPIRRWAEFRGLPAGAVWMTIRQRGTKAHPFLERALSRGDTQVAIEHTATRIGLDLIGYTFQDLGAKFLPEAE